MKSIPLPIGCWVLVAMVVAAVLFVLLRSSEKPSFEGTYLRYAEHEFGKEWDTLVIKEGISSVHRITRKWKYERVLDGGQLTPEYKVGHTTAVLLSKERLLVEEESGLRFRLEGNVLQLGETRYQKLK